MIKVGIIGFGYMGHFHYRKVQESRRAEVTAIYDISQEKLEEGRELGFATFDNIDDFLKMDIDLVVIATPNQVHALYGIKAMEAGKHVICEKPVTLTVQELEDMIETSSRTGKIFTVHQQRRWDKDYLMVNKAIRSGKIGNVTTIESRILGERGVCFGWRADPEAGGGMLYDWGVHLIDQMLELFQGETVERVYARLCSILTPAVDDYFELNLQFSHNIYAKILVSTFSLQKLPRWFVFGDRGTMKLDDMTGENGGIGRIRREVKGFDSVVGKKELGPSRTMAPLEKEYLEEVPLPSVGEQFCSFWENLLDSVEGKAEPFIKQEELVRQMKVVEAAFQSSNTESVVKVRI